MSRRKYRLFREYLLYNVDNSAVAVFDHGNDTFAPVRMVFYAAELNEQAEDMFFRLVKELAEKDGITEKLKAENQMAWVQKMNQARSVVKEIVNKELIYF